MTSSPKKPEEGAERKLERQFIIERQGRPFVLMAGLLDLAHQDGLDVIETHLIQTASGENGLVNQFRALVHTSRGTFTGHGSAGPANVSRMMLTHTLELAETRAIGRALRFATNIGMTTIEELGDDPIPGETETQPTSRAPASPPADPALPTADISGALAMRHRFPDGDPKRPTPPPAPVPIAPRSQDPEQNQHGPEMPLETQARPALNPATPAQIRAIYAIARTQHNFYEHETDDQCIAVFGVKPPELSRPQASEFITNLQGKKE